MACFTMDGRRAAAAATALTLILAGGIAQAETIASQEHDFVVEEVTRGLDHPWGMAFLPDGRMLVTERTGRLRIVANGRLEPEPVSGLPDIRVRGQGGLLDVALHPEFSDNRYVYLSYAAGTRQRSGTEVARGQLRGNRLENLEVLFRAEPKTRGGRHFGSRLAFLDGDLYISLGDRGSRELAQDLSAHHGSMIRLRDDGSTPPDNPYLGVEDARPEIYSIGHRNIQGLAVHPDTDALWSHEHGPRGGDEVNVLRPGVNYGWPVISYGREYASGRQVGEGTARDGMAQPALQWTPSIAPSGMAFYAGEAFPKWRGNLFVGALVHRKLVRLVLGGERVVHQEELLVNQVGRIRDVRTGPDGLIYLLTDAPSPRGAVLRLRPAVP